MNTLPTAGFAPADIEKRAGYECGVHCEPCWTRRKRVTPAAGHWGSMPYCNPCRIDDRVPHSEWVPAGRAEAPSAQSSPAPAAAKVTERREYPADVEAEASDSAEEIRREVEADLQAKREKFVGKFDAAQCACGCGNAVFAGKRYFRGHKPPAKSQPVQTTPTPRYGSPPKEKSEMMKPCKCGCGQETNRHTGYLWGHKGLAAKASKAPKTVATLRVRTPAAPAVDPDAPERVQISVNAAYLDHFWQGRSTAEKARMVSNFFSEAGA